MASTVESMERLIAVHDWSQDEAGPGMGATSMGAQACRHWAEWGDLLERDPHSPAVDDALVATDRSLAIALGLLPFTGVPASWTALARSIPTLPALRGLELVRRCSVTSGRHGGSPGQQHSGDGKEVHRRLGTLWSSTPDTVEHYRAC